MAPTPKRAAFFDVDNTLTRGSTLYFLGRGMYQRGFFSKKDISRFVFANLRFKLTGKEKPEEMKRWQNAATEFIAGHKVDDIALMAQEVYDQYVSPALWQGTIDIAQTHLSNDEEVWLVTAAPEEMAALISRKLGFTGAIGSRAETADGFYTGRMCGNLLHGKEKVVAIKELAASHGFNLKDCYAYSDSHNDLPLLLGVGHPSAINPDAILRIRALREMWPIHDFRRARILNRILGPIFSRLASIVTLIAPSGRKRSTPPAA
jgi:HAD superfamily hydrolase (TIGR01490 family)